MCQPHMRSPTHVSAMHAQSDTCVRRTCVVRHTCWPHMPIHPTLMAADWRHGSRMRQDACILPHMRAMWPAVGGVLPPEVPLFKSRKAKMPRGQALSKVITNSTDFLQQCILYFYSCNAYFQLWLVVSLSASWEWSAKMFLMSLWPVKKIARWRSTK